MHGKLTLSFSVATFIAAIGLLFFLSDVRQRVRKLELDVQGREAAEEAAEPKPGPADDAEPLVDGDVAKKVDWMVRKLEEIHTQVYEGVIDLESEMYQLRQDMKSVRARVSRILDGLRASGDFPGFQSSLPQPQAELTIEQRKAYQAEAKQWGMRVSDGLVIARGLLNGEQDRAYPIEYFMTRYPEAGHETLVHLLGNARLEDWAEPPFPRLDGLATTLYKALLAAGFQQGKYGHPEREPKEPFEQVPWVPATGDAVYMYMRWTDADGKPVFARATDWMLDPNTKSVLPADAFKFTGSMRVEHRETGDEMLLSEGTGFLVSAYPDRSAMIEVAVPDLGRGHLLYNWSRLPKHEEGKPFYMDMIFSRTALDEEALQKIAPLTPPAAEDEAKDGEEK